MKGEKGLVVKILFVTLLSVFTYACSGTVKNRYMYMEMSELQYIEGEVLVNFRRDVDEKRILEILSKERMVLIDKIEDMKLYRVRIESGMSVKDAIKRLRRYREVEKVQPNYIRRVKG